MINEIRNELIYIDLIMNKPEAEKSNYYSLLIVQGILFNRS